MVIDGRIPDISRELQTSNDAKDAVSRQRSATSGLSEDSSSKQIVSQQSNTVQYGRNGHLEDVIKPIDVQGAVEKLNSLARSQQRNVSFSVDEEAEVTVIKIIKTETGELIKQIPSEEILALRAKLRQNSGWFFDGKG